MKFWLLKEFPRCLGILNKKNISNLSNFSLSGDRIWPKEYYCVIQMESIHNSKPRYHVCPNQSISEGCLKEWNWIDFKLIPGLLLISMIFLLMTFLLVYLEQREKLFG